MRHIEEDVQEKANPFEEESMERSQGAWCVFEEQLPDTYILLLIVNFLHADFHLVARKTCGNSSRYYEGADA